MTGCPILRAQGTKQVQKGRLPSGQISVMDTGRTDGRAEFLLTCLWFNQGFFYWEKYEEMGLRSKLALL